MADKNIFISYSRDDLDTVTALVKELRKGGLNVWFDSHIRSGDQWDEVIEQQIKQADVIIVVLSKTSVASDNVMDEVSYGINRGKRITPVKIEECEIPMRIARFHYIDYQKGDQEAIERLVSDIQFDQVIEPAPDDNEDEKPVRNRKGLKIAIGIIVLIILGFIAVRWMDTGKPTRKVIPSERVVKTPDKEFFMRVESYFNNDGRTVVSGYISKGEAVTGNLVDVISNEGVVLSAKITRLSDGQKYVQKAESGQRVSFILSGVSIRDLKKGTVICAPGNCN